TCNTDMDCGTPYKCEARLHLCWEQTNGYVWSGKQQMWTQPPTDVLGCGPNYVFWPLKNGCYDPKSGYAFDPNARTWVYIGDNYTPGQDKATNDGGCSFDPSTSEQGGAGWLSAGLLGAAAVFASRRRRSS